MNRNFKSPATSSPNMANGNGESGTAFLSTLLSRSYTPKSTPPQAHPANTTNGTPRYNYQPTTRSARVQPRGIGVMGTTSPERMLLQISLVEKKCNEVMERMTENNCQIIDAIKSMKEALSQEIQAVAASGQKEMRAEFQKKFEEIAELVSKRSTTTTTTIIEELKTIKTQTPPTVIAVTPPSQVQVGQVPLSELFKPAVGSKDCNPTQNLNSLKQQVTEQTAAPITPILGKVTAPAPAQPPKTPTQPSFNFTGFNFGVGGGIGFGDLANSTSPKTFEIPKDFKGFGGEGKPIFSSFAPTSTPPRDSQRRQSTNSEGDAAEEYESTAEFAPVVPLPPLVEVSLGDENENVLFEHRAKIYRFDGAAKEWKERGLGNIKILQNKENSHNCRVVMWREKVGKLACNHRITGDMKIEFYQDNPKVVRWSAIDHAEDEGKPEIFTARFGQEDKCAEFKKKFEEIVELVAHKSEDATTSPKIVEALNATKTPPAVTVAPSSQVPLSELFKPVEGSWDCAACYLNNKETATKCISCGAPNHLKPQLPQPTATPTPIFGQIAPFPSPAQPSFNFTGFLNFGAGDAFSAPLSAAPLPSSATSPQILQVPLSIPTVWAEFDRKHFG